jgi:hypothetical protein
MEDTDWVRDPFGVFSTFLSSIAHKELRELKAAISLKLKFREMSLGPFRLSVREEYSLASEIAVRILLSFSTIMNLCELGVSTLTEIKTQKRTRLGTTDEANHGCVI